jgi:DNA polymerase-1
MRIVRTDELTEETVLDANTREWLYNGLDCAVTLEIVNHIKPQLSNVTSSTYDFSRALQAPILEMMMRGILIDLEKRREVVKLYKDQTLQLEGQLDRLLREGIGTSLNWRSNTQLQKLFYEVLSLPPVKKRSANGAMVPTVNREALEKLQLHFFAEPLILHILLLRDIAKKLQLLETGIDPDARIRTNLNIAGTKTGRLASSMSDMGTGTNLQNIDRELRSVFIADPGMKFCNIDLEQADARNVGARCWDLFVEPYGEGFAGAYLDACESSDLHTSVAKMCWPGLGWGQGRADREIADTPFYRTLTHRDTTKRLGHGTNFRGTAPHMAVQTKIPSGVVKAFQQQYFAAFPCIPKWHEWINQTLAAEHQLVTLWGRQRYFFGRADDPKTLRDATAYEPQSCTAEEINHALLKLWRWQRVQLLMQVHDSILFQYPEHLEDEIVPAALKLARAPLTLSRGREFCVPLDAKVGWNWGDQQVWTKADAEKDKCLPAQVGTVKANADGLVKWKGHDPRERGRKPMKWSLQ